MHEPMTFSAVEPRQSSVLVSLVNRAYSPQPEAAGWVGDRAFQPGDRTDDAEVSAMLADPATVVLVGSRGGVVRRPHPTDRLCLPRTVRRRSR
ncbi:hypothetical protein, partial [Pontibacter rugosus]